MKQQFLFSLSLFIFFLFYCTTTLAQSPSPAPGPPRGPTNVIKILKKAGQFKSFILELVQFHIVPTFISTSQSDTVTNHLKTHAGSGGRFQLNVTTSGNLVNITTGLINTTISDTVYTDDHLAIYKVDKVLLPLDIFTPKPPAPAPALATTKTKAESPDEEDDDDIHHKNTSGTVSSVTRSNLCSFCNIFFVTSLAWCMILLSWNGGW
ncbi:hypothetical protein P3X46_000234 [Hevea brasiliensis]|uniref:FAS1 domain-containing protein n=1 Tax=Hevea brasiliensis TaxID=3981 RepID=A0ABQ9NAS0_HEVBR|nr:hypothetical protein P3X46_000234 [Hevea brasiliensis]